MLSLIPALPLLGFLVNASLGRRFSRALSGTLASAMMFAAFAVSLVAVWRLAALGPETRFLDQTLYTWIASGEFRFDLALRLDPLSAVMILVVTGIGFLIHLYSTAYMHEETPPEYARYFSYLNLFAAFMLVLVLAANFLVMFIGWEGVGLCSYLLIGFWFERRTATDAGKKAFIVNRVGDYAFILGMLMLVTHFGTLDFRELASVVAPLSPEAGFGTVSIAALLLFVGATGKSAQIPLYVWLPDAMEGPTPVSALIHAATMVTAGVYMIGRNAVLYSRAPEVLTIVATIGLLTAVLAGTIALVQTDIKRVLAYSTVSQLGYMFLAMGVGAFGAGIFHLYTHAFFKALLFLGAGSVIHALGGEQDIRRMGGLRQALPVTYWTFLVGALAIAGIPGLAGFFSKDEILYETFAGGHALLWLVGVLTSLMTAVYMFRLVFLTFHVAPATTEHDHERHLHDAPAPMAIALVVLAIGSVLAGYAGVPAALGGRNHLGAWLQPSFEAPMVSSADFALPDEPGSAPNQAPEPIQEQEASAGTEHGSVGLERGLMTVSSVVAIGGVALAMLLFLRRRDLTEMLGVRFAGVHHLLLRKYYVDDIYDAAIVRPIHAVAEDGLWRGVDVRVIDGAVNGTGAIVEWSSSMLRRLQTGSVRAYASSVFVGVILILSYYFWR